MKREEYRVCGQSDIYPEVFTKETFWEDVCVIFGGVLLCSSILLPLIFLAFYLCSKG